MPGATRHQGQLPDPVAATGSLPGLRLPLSDRLAPRPAAMTSPSARLRQWARALKRQTLTLWFCYRHGQTPWLPRTIAVIVVAYALSPIDLIPDFIPILGYLDDVILLPLGIWLALRLMPPAVLAECAARARQWEKNQGQRPVNRIAAVVIVLCWIAALASGWWLVRGSLTGE